MKKSNLISKSQTVAVLREMSERWGIGVSLDGAKNLMVHQIGAGQEIISGGGLVVLHTDGEHVPFLTQTSLLERFPSVTVDMGAVRFVCNGANVMRPGIKEHSEFAAGQIVAVVEESRRKFLAVGRAVVPSTEVGSMEKGEVVKNIHYISDKFWEIGKAIRG